MFENFAKFDIFLKYLIKFDKETKKMKKIGIIGAMDEEVAYLKSIAQNKIEENGFTSGTIDGVQVVIAMSGIGKVNAAICTQKMISEYKVTNVINTGIAGAIAHRLKVLDFVASTDAVYHDFDVTGFGYEPTVIPRMETSAFPADEKMQKAAIETFTELSNTEVFANHKIISGRIASGDQFISNKDVKNRIIDICNPSCVEMEGAAIAHTCFVNQIPYLVLRCMSDTADDGDESTYKFNDKIAAEMSAKLVQNIVGRI